MTLIGSTPALVLDTNVVLDWLVFHDPSCRALGEAIVSGAVRWLATDPQRAEFDAVLARGVGAKRSPQRAALHSLWHRHALLLPAAPPSGGFTPCRCADPDDQKFVDLALHSRARWLLSRDRAVLELAGLARRSGLLIVPPAHWALADASA